MEEKGIEWVCPNCSKKKDEELKTKASMQIASGKQRIQSDATPDNSIVLKNLSSPNQTSVIGETSSLVPSASDYGSVQYSSGMQCVVCKKEARNSSIYCSDACILAHAQETLTKDKPSPVPTPSPKITKLSPFDAASKPKPEARVIVFERKTGKILSGELMMLIINYNCYNYGPQSKREILGSDAPTRSTLRMWLKENPTFEVVGANNLGTLQVGKTITTIHTQVPGKAVSIQVSSSIVQF